MAFVNDVFCDNLVACAGTNQATATPLRGTYNLPTAASVDGTKGCKLPQDAPVGTAITIANRSGGANSLNVYTALSTGFIHATAGSTANTIAQNKVATYVLMERTTAGVETWAKLAGA
jgi:hypothetical protein